MGVYTDYKETKTIIFYQGVHKYVIVTEIVIFDQVYVTGYNCTWPFYRVWLLQVTGPATAITTNFRNNSPYVLWIY